SHRRIVETMRQASARHVNRRSHEDVTLKVGEPDVATRPKVDVLIDPGSGGREDGSKFDHGRRGAVSERPHQKGAPKVLSDNPGKRRQRLRRSFERTIPADECTSQ